MTSHFRVRLLRHRLPRPFGNRMKLGFLAPSSKHFSEESGLGLAGGRNVFGRSVGIEKLQRVIPPTLGCLGYFLHRIFVVSGIARNALAAAPPTRTLLLRTRHLPFRRCPGRRFPSRPPGVSIRFPGPPDERQPIRIFRTVVHGRHGCEFCRFLLGGGRGYPASCQKGSEHQNPTSKQSLPLNNREEHFQAILSKNEIRTQREFYRKSPHPTSRANASCVGGGRAYTIRKVVPEMATSSRYWLLGSARASDAASVRCDRVGVVGKGHQPSIGFAGVAQLVEHNVANVVVVGSNPITRSSLAKPFFLSP